MKDSSPEKCLLYLIRVLAHISLKLLEWAEGMKGQRTGKRA